MLYDVSTKEKYEKRVNEMLEKGYIYFLITQNPIILNTQKVVITEIVNYCYTHFITALHGKTKCNIQQRVYIYHIRIFIHLKHLEKNMLHKNTDRRIVQWQKVR